QILTLLENEARPKEIRLLNEIPTGTVANSDPNMISLLLRNLVSNAVKYTPAGGAVRIYTEMHADAFRLVVEDSGIGMSPHMVEAFNSESTGRMLASTPGTGNEKGTGIGLVLCRNFAALMKARIWVESKQGTGSRFILEFPDTLVFLLQEN